ncbi:MAG: D-inositol-3-phosphate glycosyltransferase, partial [Candidatus Phosphoribacter baldrii]
LADPARREVLAGRAVRHASGFGWAATTERLLQAYGEACRTQTPSPITEASLLTGVPAALVP